MFSIRTSSGGSDDFRGECQLIPTERSPFQDGSILGYTLLVKEDVPPFRTGQDLGSKSPVMTWSKLDSPALGGMLESDPGGTLTW